MERDIYLYDIILNGQFVGDQGDGEFSTETEAKADASEYITTELCKEYNAAPEDFKVECYQGKMYV